MAESVAAMAFGKIGLDTDGKKRRPARPAPLVEKPKGGIFSLLAYRNRGTLSFAPGINVQHE
jgi:hypothetical protein